MQLADFPLLVNGLSDFGDRRIARTAQAVAAISEGVEEGSILNVRWKEAKDDINRAFEHAYNALFTHRLLANRGEMSNEEQEIYYKGKPRVDSLEGFTKWMRKRKAEIASDIIRWCESVQPLANAVASLKDKVVKRKLLSDEEKREAKFTPPPATTKAAETVTKLLEDIVNKAYNNLLDSIFRHNQELLTGYLKAQMEVENGERERDRFNQREREKKFGFDPYEYFTDTVNGRRQIDTKSARLVQDCVDQVYVKDARPDLTDVYPYDVVYVVKGDAEEVLRKAATEDADEIRMFYVVKNLKKIVSILEAKGDDLFLSAEEGKLGTQLGGLQGEIIFHFKDGSSFRVNNDIVFGIKYTGTRYVQFPLRFHDVVLPGGKPMKNPSEKAMNSTFIGK